MTDRFREVLNELSLLLNTPLDPDRHGACRLRVGETLHIQIECQEEKHRLLIATFLGEIPPGKFRANVLKDALKSNYVYPKIGILSYAERLHQLSLFDYISMYQLSGQRLLNHLNAFIEKAERWRLGIETGNTTALAPAAQPPSSNPFNLRP